MRRLAFLCVLSGCRGGDVSPGYAVSTGGDARRGEQAIAARHCGVCHDIDGVPGAHGVIGPSLDGVGERSYIAGILPNTPTNLVRWIREPKTILPHSAMPTLGIGEPEAKDIAAYLYDQR